MPWLRTRCSCWAVSPMAGRIPPLAPAGRARHRLAHPPQPQTPLPRRPEERRLASHPDRRPQPPPTGQPRTRRHRRRLGDQPSHRINGRTAQPQPALPHKIFRKLPATAVRPQLRTVRHPLCPSGGGFHRRLRFLGQGVASVRLSVWLSLIGRVERQLGRDGPCARFVPWRPCSGRACMTGVVRMGARGSGRYVKGVRARGVAEHGFAICCRTLL